MHTESGSLCRLWETLGTREKMYCISQASHWRRCSRRVSGYDANRRLVADIYFLVEMYRHFWSLLWNIGGEVRRLWSWALNTSESWSHHRNMRGYFDLPRAAIALCLLSRTFGGWVCIHMSVNLVYRNVTCRVSFWNEIALQCTGSNPPLNSWSGLHQLC